MPRMWMSRNNVNNYMQMVSPQFISFAWNSKYDFEDFVKPLRITLACSQLAKNKKQKQKQTTNKQTYKQTNQNKTNKKQTNKEKKEKYILSMLLL